jgi:tetratricopeptide (TPR) repeat protein
LTLFDEVKKSYYEILKVEKTAGIPEIKKAYFGLVRKYQPDRFPEQFKEIRAAYETLSDGKKRAEYDAIGRLPPSAAPLFHEAQYFDRLGRRGKAAELYRIILKRHPELDTVREQYASSLFADHKTGKAAEEWEELCRRHPDNPRYARNLGESYSARGWHKKALVEVRRSLALESSSIDGWNLLISCVVMGFPHNPNTWDELYRIAHEALEAVKEVKTDEWRKISLITHAVLACDRDKIELVRAHMRELIRLIRGGGRAGQDEGRWALKEILRVLPNDGLVGFYPEIREMADLFPDLHSALRGQLDDIRLSVDIEDLPNKNFHEIFRDLFRILNSDFEEENDDIEAAAIELTLLEEKPFFEPFILRLKTEFPELYGLHRSFFDELLRGRALDRMMRRRLKQVRKFQRQSGIVDDDPDSEQFEPVRRDQPKVGRNDPCPCGSGKKYKRCCGA